MNMDKTQVMTNSQPQPIQVNATILQYVEEYTYTYLGQLVGFKSCMEKELRRRIASAWRAFWSLKFVFLNKKQPQTKTGGTTILYLPNFTLRLPDLETYREPEETDPKLPAQNGEENPRTLPQRQDLEHQIKTNDKHKRHDTSRGGHVTRLQMDDDFHHVGSTHREAKPRQTRDQMGGLLQEHSRTNVVQNSQGQRKMEIATKYK